MGPLVENGGGSDGTLVGWVLVGAGALDLLTAFFFAFVRPIPDERARKFVTFALALGALVCFGLGALFLTGVLGGGE